MVIIFCLQERTDDVAAGEMLINRYLFVHAVKHSDKLECLIHMLRKLYAFAQGEVYGDNADALMNHELLLPGHLMTMYVKEKLEETLIQVKGAEITIHFYDITLWFL